MIDLRDRHFGRLKVIRPTEQRLNGNVVWECECECGNITYVSEYNLTSGNTRSCGCMRGEKSKLDLSNKHFGWLKAIRPTEQRINNLVVWECECKCGNIVYASTQQLQSGDKKSCGCMRGRKGGKGGKGGRSRLDLSNRNFGWLKAIRPTEQRIDRKVVWECECKCGNIVYASTRQLQSGDKKSCGCMRGKHTMIDLTGQRFGRLVAIRPTEERYNKTMVVWECQCDCGKIKRVPATLLRNGTVKSCGCMQLKKTMLDLRGKHFGHLKAIRPTEERVNGLVVWECECECGNITYASTRQLKSGSKTSCGCMRGEKHD